ncbi:glutamine amidotransferase-related protein [Thalassomonas actiniarum]|uniref:GMP synthase n=1 Tax=Thalassomonas actiniarum TaxID=485447 RepID=A0AAE9YIY0_9GAMM|nr:hypothetical protein [Thalassomonas actiniarum]WDD96950.1 GMP synthase [Thalassomonas actiniarum]
MKLGILLCDHVQEKLQVDFGGYPDMFSKILLAVDDQLDIVYYSAVDGELPSDINACDCYMTSGSKFGVNDELPWLNELEDFIRRLYREKKGFVGICFGHQLLARALGGKVQRSDKGWGIGVAAGEIVKQKSWMEPKQANLSLVVSHQDQISELPADTEVLLSNEFCPYSMIQLDDHFLGLQGHPEFSRIYSYALMNSRRDRIPGPRISAGVVSLEEPVDDLLTVRWLLNFLQQTIAD